MIDKQKLIKWIEDKHYVYSAPPEDGDTSEEIAMWKGKVQLLNTLDMYIRAGSLDACEDEPGPRFKMDAVGNLTLVEDDAE